MAKVFDFDDCLVKTTAQVVVNGTPVSSSEYSTGAFHGMVCDFSQFDDPELIMGSKPLPLLAHMRECFARKEQVYILTARSTSVQFAIWQYLQHSGIKIGLDRIMCVGADSRSPVVPDVPKAKVDILTMLVAKHKEVTFYDDSERNIQLARKVAGVLCVLVNQQERR